MNDFMHPDQKRIYQSMTPEQKLKTALRLYYSAQRIKAAALRAQHPDWPEEKIDEVLRKYSINART